MGSQDLGKVVALGPSTAMIQRSQQTLTHSEEKYSYSMIQGNFDNNYELVVALKRKEDSNTFPNHGMHTKPMPPKSNHGIHPKPPVVSSNQDAPHPEHEKKVPMIVPSKIEKIPSKKVEGITKCGPWGGNGGTVFDDGVYDGIRQIHISRNVGIASIRVCYELNGQPVWGSKNGGAGGFKTDKIVFDYPSEILTHITGYHSPTMVMGPTTIRSLTFHTTKGRHGPYGEEKGTPFSSNSPHGGMVVGFHGREGLFIDAIGVHVLEGKYFPAPAPAPLPAPSRDPAKHATHNPLLLTNGAHDHHNSSQSYLKVGKKWLTDDEAVQRIVKDPAPYGPGPWGGEGGKPWDDGVFTGIKQIILSSCDAAICSMEVEYDRNGQSVWSVKHGGHGGNHTHRVKLDYPNEVLTCISGYYGPINKENNMRVIKSLTFYTTRGKIGPFGEELGSYFTSNTTVGKVVGFHGRCGIYLDAIGVHMQHWLGYNQRTAKPSTLKKMFS